MRSVMDGKPGANALGNAVAYLRITNYELRITNYELLITCALCKFMDC